MKTIDLPPEEPTTQALARVESGVGAALPPEQIKAPVSAAQAKVDAVASLTMQAYQRAATLQLKPEEIAALQADFPDSAFQPGAGGKEHLIYIEHASLRDRLNQVIGIGQWALIPRNRWAEPFRTKPSRDNPDGKEGSRVYVEAMLVVRGCFVAEAVGAMEYYPDNAAQNYGDAVEGAKTAALRRCCKEFGIGLQAWKKEWTEGWWQRKRGGRSFGPTPRANRAPPAPPSAGEEDASFDASSPQNAPPNAPRPNSGSLNAVPKVDKCATERTRQWAIEQLHANAGQDANKLVVDYLQKCGQLLATESITDWPLRFVPANHSQLRELTLKIAAFEAGEPAQAAFPPNPEPEPPKPPKPIEVPRDPKPTPPAGESDAQAQGWYNFIVPIPRKGQKRDDYIKAPDTIGSLYEARHGTDADAQEARQRLFGFVTKFEPKGWTKRDGTEMPPSKVDIEFRDQLDDFADFFAKHHPEEKL